MDLALISMPWAIFNRPSIQLGTLKAYLRQQLPDIKVRALHPYLEVAALIGLDSYRKIAESPWAAEALYCGLLFPGQRKAAAGVFRQFMAKQSVPEYDTLLSLLEEQMQDWIRQQDFSSSGLLGFSVCFSQLPSSLYAARIIKENFPELPIVFGGSTCTEALGRSMLATFSDIDYVITGEGEQALCELVRHCREGAPLQQGNILDKGQSSEAALELQATELPDLASLPVPEYDDYFEQMTGCGQDFIPTLPLEFSRGCWWNKCTFCNLNLQWQGYRFKKSDQVLHELDTLLQRYQSLDFTFTDNSLPPGEADRFFSATAAGGRDLRFFGEIRTLKRAATYNLYSKGGLRSVQVGIEALSDSLLKRMCKGSTVMDNLAAMKFSQAAGMVLDGNLILEFPGSTNQEVAETLHILELALPFRPLTGAGFFLGHGSPVCEHPKNFGIKSIVRHPLNQKLYPPEILRNLEMLIKSYRGTRTVQKKLWQPVRERIQFWQDFHRQRPNPALPPLGYRDGGQFLLIRQELPDRTPLHHRLRGLSRKIYLACNEPVTLKELSARFSQVTTEQLGAFLNDLEQKKLVYCNETSCLALAVKMP